MELGEDVFMYRPPINRLMRTLDRSFFHRKYKITAARVSNVQNISEISQSLQKTKEVLRARMLAPVQPDPDVRDKKCILLAPEVQPDGIRNCRAIIHDQNPPANGHCRPKDLEWQSRRYGTGRLDKHDPLQPGARLQSLERS